MRKYLAYAIASFCILHCALCIPASAQVPLRMEVETSEARTRYLDVYRGETVALELAFRSYGEPLAFADGTPATVFWQTNGMAAAWWTAPATTTTNGLVSASWTPAMDCGADRYALFVGVGETSRMYRASFQVRMRGAPGAEPNELPRPVRLIDFATVSVTNAPWLETETDPTVPAWAKAETPPVTEETDPTVPEWAKAETPPLSAESDPVFAEWLAPNTPAAPEPASSYAYPGDWQLAVADAGSTNSQGVSEVAKRDYLSLVAAAQGIYRRYRVEAVPESAIIPGGVTAQPVTLSVRDPQGCVADFTDGVVSASGVSGTAFVTGVDTTGVSRTVSLAMTPVAPGGTLSEMYAESDDPDTERRVWTTNLLARIAAISTNAADMVDYRWCRDQSNWASGNAGTHRLVPRALSRFGTGGRLADAEWTWGGSGADKARFAPKIANADFFWPELLPNLRCFNALAHETTASGNNSQCYPYIAIAPHYVMTAGHYSPYWWPGMRDSVQPYFITDIANGTFKKATTDRLVGKVPRGDGTVADLMVIHVTTAIPSNCLARFATDATLERLSKSKFAKCAALTITGHQTVAPVCLNMAQSGSIYSWAGEPGASALAAPYLANSGDAGKAMALEHPVHMFDSGDPVFLASPSGKVVPLSIFCTSNGRSGSGPRIPALLDSLSDMVRADSAGTEDIRYWSFADLWSGVGTNSLEEAAQ